MTSIIGGRGTGKSSIIQFVRLILDKKEELPKALQKEFDDFVNISKNRTELGMFTDSTVIVTI
jgi:predicted ATPase